MSHSDSFADADAAKQARIDEQIARWLKSGYSREDLFVCPDGTVVFDPEAIETRIFKDWAKRKSDPKPLAE